jgi:hypothetical protein
VVLVSSRRPSPIFLLSPADCSGRRAAMLLRPGADFLQAVALRDGKLTLGDAFAFLSGLYFRGKIAYARRFGPRSSFVITTTRGLQPPDTIVTAELLIEFADSDVRVDNRAYRGPLERDVARLPAEGRVVLLGSVATGKYVDVLSPLLGARLHFPRDFTSLGDMSRGAILLRRAAAGDELDYHQIRAGDWRHRLTLSNRVPSLRVSRKR